MRTGRIIALEESGQGGVIEDINQQEISFVISNDVQLLQLGQWISFEIELGENGLFATNLKPISVV